MRSRLRIRQWPSKRTLSLGSFLYLITYSFDEPGFVLLKFALYLYYFNERALASISSNLKRTLMIKGDSPFIQWP